MCIRDRAIGLDGHEHIGGLHADLEVREVQAIEMLDMTQRGFHQRLGRRLAVLLLQVLFQGAGVDADADRDALVARSLDHRLDAILAADVARVDAQAIDAQLGHAQGDLVVEVNVGHQRYAHLLLDTTKGPGGVHVRYGKDVYKRQARVNSAPLGLCGELRKIRRVRGLMASLRRCQSTAKSGNASGTCTQRPPASSTDGS